MQENKKTISSDMHLQTCQPGLNPKPGCCGPKTFSSSTGREKFFGPLVAGSGSMINQKILKISVLRLAENATF